MTGVVFVIVLLLSQFFLLGSFVVFFILWWSVVFSCLLLSSFPLKKTKQRSFQTLWDLQNYMYLQYITPNRKKAVKLITKKIVCISHTFP